MENDKKYKWYKIANNKDEFIFPSNGLLQVNVATKRVCIAKVKDSLYACTSKCPHAGGNISDGFIDALNNVVCPLHRYKFNLQNGRNVSGEGYYLKTYPLRITNEGIYIGIEEKGLFTW